MDSLEQIVMNNPQVKQLMQSGLSYEQVFRQLCKQKGINADEYIKKLQQSLEGKKDIERGK